MVILLTSTLRPSESHCPGLQIDMWAEDTMHALLASTRNTRWGTAYGNYKYGTAKWQGKYRQVLQVNNFCVAR